MKHLQVLLPLCFLSVACAPMEAVSLTDSDRSSAIPCPADRALSDLVAESDQILVGIMNAPRQRLAEEGRTPEWLEIPISVASVIKGDEAGRATVRFYANDAPYQPSNANVRALSEMPAMLFLTRIDERPAGLYFSGHSPAALRPASETNIAAVRAEVSRQAMILRSWRANPTLPHYNQVRELTARLGRVQGNEQQRVFDRLQALGPEAVPAIIAQMDDRRPLRTREISLENRSPDAWEATRHYGPEQVVDGLDAVLNQITGANFGSIENGGSEGQRSATVAGWRIYASDLGCRA